MLNTSTELLYSGYGMGKSKKRCSPKRLFATKDLLAIESEARERLAEPNLNQASRQLRS